MRLILSLEIERLERCLTQEEMSEAVGIPQSTWSRAERGEQVSPGTARKISKYLKREPREVWDFGTFDEAAAA